MLPSRTTGTLGPSGKSSRFLEAADSPDPLGGAAGPAAAVGADRRLGWWAGRRAISRPGGVEIVAGSAPDAEPAAGVHRNRPRDSFAVASRTSVCAAGVSHPDDDPAGVALVHRRL